MTGKFEGLTDVQWDLLKPLMPPDPPKRGKGKPHTPWRKICNTIFWVIITGARWADVPIGQQWGSRSASHHWLGVWQADGTLDKLLKSIREMAFLGGLIDWNRLAADGFFFRG